jgi:hypothetical protein
LEEIPVGALERSGNVLREGIRGIGKRVGMLGSALEVEDFSQQPHAQQTIISNRCS